MGGAEWTGSLEWVCREELVGGWSGVLEEMASGWNCKW